MRKRLPAVIALLCICWATAFMPQANGQTAKPVQPVTAKKELNALRIDDKPKIDGVLDEQMWANAQIATDFIQNRPNPGPRERFPTQVKILYDDEALYIGAVMQEASPDSIFKALSSRDNLGNADWFGIFLDTYNDEINGYGFFITPAGVQLDARYSANGEDFSWNAVWESATSIQGNTWVAEVKVPYSAIRFSARPEQLWGLNFMRNRQSTRQGYFWNHVDPAKDGFVNQWGLLLGIKSITPPTRLSFTPYVSAVAKRYPVQSLKTDETSFEDDLNFSGGMDLKYGINDAFTLDMTLVPDFSQVQSDNQVLNLSPFEIQYNENRPFFLEGTELFNKGGFFYSRRVGSRPVHYRSVSRNLPEHVVVTDNPTETRMLNGTKVSGRTKDGLGIGVFNAIVGRSFATLRDTLTGVVYEQETQPLTNYNVTVLDQSLKNNSYVSFVNTNVLRQGSTYDANLSALLFRFNTKGNKYAVDGNFALSQQYFTNDTELGYTYSLGAGKTSGNFTYSLSHIVKSDTYNPNDLGINFYNNLSEQRLHLQYNIYQPFWKLLNMRSNIGAIYSRRHDTGDFQNFVIYSGLNGTFKGFLSAGLNFNLEPVLTYDFFEPRVSGRYYEYPVNYSVGGYISSDYSKKFALDVNFNYRWFDENNRNNFGYGISPRFRPNDKLLLVYRFEKFNNYDEMGYVHNSDHENIYFGMRDVNNISNSLEAQYVFNNKMSLSLLARHNWSKAFHRAFFDLQPDGKLTPSAHTGNYDRNFNYFNLDLVYSWWFAPGSELAIVWKDAFLEETNVLKTRYFDNINHTFSSPQSNMLSVKVLYYIDYLTIKNRFGKQKA